jgi:glucose-1-phosphate adenylyltransferase
MCKILTFILAGGKGERLYPLTRDRAKPAVPFGGVYRIIDFPLSNCINSQLRKIYILSQYKSLSLNRHIQLGWNNLSRMPGEFITLAHAQQRLNEHWYRGTADALFQNIYLLQKEKPDLVLILAGDHVYKMDYQKMIDFHIQQKAEVTVGAAEMGKETSAEFGVIQINDTGQIIGFQEKPRNPFLMPGTADKILASMGIYIFNTDVMVKSLIKDAKRRTAHDFGKNIIPAMISTNHVCCYRFVDDQGKPDYWRDVGTIEAYYEANMDLLSVYPELNLSEHSRPIHTYQGLFPPAIILTSNVQKQGRGYVKDSVISNGCVIYGNVKRSLFSPNVRVESFSQVEDSILLNDVTIREHAHIRRTIIDKGSIIPPGMQIGYKPEEDAKRFTLTKTGLVVVPRNFRSG